MNHYALHVETWRGPLRQCTEHLKRIVYVTGAARALEEAQRLHAEATAAGLGCSVIRRDSRGRGRVFDAQRGRLW